MGTVVIILVVMYCLAVLVPLWIGIDTYLKMQRMPTVIDYVNRLHKYQDPQHPEVRALYLTGDENFQRRARQLNELWQLKTTLPNYAQYLADINPEHRDDMLRFIDTGELVEGSDLEHEINTNPVYQKVLDQVIGIQSRRLRRFFGMTEMK